MNSFLALPIVVPIVAAGFLVMARDRAFQRTISLIVLSASVLISIITLVQVADSDSIETTALGGWRSSIAIVLVADRLSALMMVISSIVLLSVLIFAIGQSARDEQSPFYLPAYLVLSAGLSQAFLAGDLFNMFVAFELLLMASYVLLTLEGTNAQIRSGTTYVVLNVVESMVLLLAVGLVFAATGSVNMAVLAERLAELPDSVALGLNLLLLTAFGIKAAVFPLFFWLPDSYPSAPSSVTAVFAGLLTKVGVYAIIRTETLLFPGGQENLLLVIGGATMLIGVLGAMSHVQMKRILSFHIVSQIGYMIMGIGFGTTIGLAATVFYLVHHIPVKASLFLVEGIVEKETGSSSFDRVSGLASRSGLLAVLFLIPALSLAGLPPFSGFLAKFSLVREGFADGRYGVVVVAIFVSLLTLVSMTKIWTGLFWGDVTPEPPAGRVGVLRHHRLMSASTIAIVGGTLLIAVLAGPLYDYCEAAARQLADPSRYIGAVIGS
ncbi:MAG: proton-conducting transporter membrane subunit [Actinomycetota bacterium]|nr:proton-conducting transporter membrane subunit [Actinomycetota bacterium]MDA2972423.1 proton-conducting transporter membrane subunit [Actinomycetota bacterium]MDA3001863.1 proton-conducting transporter membrane subunit [Actinomycetota bacterium]